MLSVIEFTTYSKITIYSSENDHKIENIYQRIKAIYTLFGKQKKKRKEGPLLTFFR